jgi:SAM-dependent methyltransferase
VDISAEMLQSATARFSGSAGFRCLKPDENIEPGSCDLIFCTETLEHVGDAAAVLDIVLRTSSPGARLLISVPIEVGPSLLLKQAGRAFTNLFRPYGYDRYSPWELFQAVALWRTDAFLSSHSKDETSRRHKGFDYRKLGREIALRFEILKQTWPPCLAWGRLPTARSFGPAVREDEFP